MISGELGTGGALVEINGVAPKRIFSAALGRGVSTTARGADSVATADGAAAATGGLGSTTTRGFKGTAGAGATSLT